MSKVYAISLDGDEYRVLTRELYNIADVVTGINPSSADYTGSAITVTPVSEIELREGIDYVITYSDNINVGECTVTVTGLGDYGGYVIYTLTIKEAKPIGEYITGITPSSAIYTGSAITVTPVSETTLVEGTDYTVSYSDNINIGTCTVTYTGIGEYSSTVSYNLTILELVSLEVFRATWILGKPMQLSILLGYLSPCVFTK